MGFDIATARISLSALAFQDEAAALQPLIALLAPLEALEPAILSHASTLVRTLREKGAGSGVEAFLHEYGLDTTEGVAIMCLAEALLRIPDTHTADKLIRDTFEDAAWEHHLGNSDSWFVNASSWGLMLTGKVVQLSDEKPKHVLQRMVRKFGDPVIRESLKKAMRFIGQQFVMGETIEGAIANAKSAKGYRVSYDMLGEGARTATQAEHYVQAYAQAIDAIASAEAGGDIFSRNSLSIKLSALHPRYSLTQRTRVLGELLPTLTHLMERAREANIMVAIDAEEASRLDIELELFTQLLEAPSLKGWNGVGFVVQAYQKRALGAVEYLAQLAKHHGRTIPLRLVKGAYWDSEIKWAQMLGLPGYPVFTRKEHTDVSYLACAQKMLQHGACFYPQFATHNARTIASIMAMAGARRDYEFQRLHGMGEKLHDLIVRDIPSRIYAPVGAHKDLLAYLIRRLLENGANTSFVNLLMDEQVPLATLLANPVAVAREHGLTANPSIALPRHLYGESRLNSQGIDFGNLYALTQLQTALTAAVTPTTLTTPTDINAAMQRTQNAQPSWAASSVQQRAEVLNRAADMLEASRDALIAMLVHEAGKTLPDAIAEVREAADFCRYYAQQAASLMQPETLVGPTGEHNQLSLHPRGVFVCISPWNFPLAIFIGQVVAALVTGNAVLAKPAEQTPNIAAMAVQILYKAGVPADVLQLVQGDGSVGAALVAHPAHAGVVFTGSVETAWRIQQSLAARQGPIVPFIAETGGLNCMVVDSSALLEAAVDDIITSAFGSAGQRCSALRVLLVQDDIADALLALIAGAMAEVRVGNPADAATDIGPVIDAQAHAMLSAHIARMQREATLFAATPMPEKLHGHFIAPHCFELASLDAIDSEIFGPVLHVVRFCASEMETLPTHINAKGYGLTFGIHSRIDAHIAHFTTQVSAGNIYVNRSMIGATVGVQPFGGEALSGTGPKAGGPHYLHRFITERTLTINTAAIGGNVALLAG